MYVAPNSCQDVLKMEDVLRLVGMLLPRQDPGTPSNRLSASNLESSPRTPLCELGAERAGDEGRANLATTTNCGRASGCDVLDVGPGTRMLRIVNCGNLVT